MNSTSTWFQDDDLLVQELRRGQSVAGHLPQIAGYQNLRELRRGGQGIVFVAEQVSTRRLVAIKIVLEGSLAGREARRRFEREIDLVAALRHPNIVQVYDRGETDDGRPFFIMEYIEGLGLDEYLGLHGPAVQADPTAGGPALRDRLVLFAKVCDGVQHAHQQGVIHRDLKPSNVRIDARGEPHVLDFGLAKLADGAPEATRMSRTGSFMGSLPWASPEQADGRGLVDVRSDVYSLGVMLYQVLTGRFPYAVDGPLRDVLHHIQHTPPQAPREGRRGLSDELATIALKCLAKEPERRYQSAGELARDLRRFLAGEPIDAKRDSAWYSVRKTLDRYRVVVRAGTVLLAASLLFSVAMAWLRARAIDAERLADQRLTDLQLAHQAEIDARQALEAQVARNEAVRDFLDTTLRAVDPWKHPGRDLGPLRELLDSAALRLHGAFPDQPEVEAAIAATLGWDYHELGLKQAAEPLLRRAYELRAATLGPEHADTRTSLNALARLMTDLGRHGEASALFEQLRAVQERTLGPEHPTTLITLNNLALDYDWQGRSAEAEALYRHTLEAQTRILGKLHPDRLNTLNNLAACLPGLGKLAEAEQLYLELVNGRSAAFGPQHPETLQARLNLAHLFAQDGRFAESERRMRALQLDVESALPEGHPIRSMLYHNLAFVVSSLGRPEEGLELCRRAYETQLAYAGPDDLGTLGRQNELTCTLIELRRWDAALPLAADLRDRYVRLLGAGDWRTLIAAGNLAYAQNQAGQTAEAEANFRAIIATPTDGHEAAVAAVATARANLGGLLADQERWEEAERTLRAALEGQQQAGVADHWRTALMNTTLGRVLAETGRLAEAEQVLLGAYPVLAATLGDDHPRTQRAVAALVRLFELAGDGGRAAEFRGKLTPAGTADEAPAQVQ